MGSNAAGVDDTFGDPFVVKVEDLLAEVKGLEQRRSTSRRPQRVLVVGHGCPVASSMSPVSDTV
jgi:hypothetical protein